jgi:hypothetical protein
MKQISTTTLSKFLNITTKELFAYLLKCNLILRKDQSWVLTSEGEKKGGTYRESQKYGRYIVWPENINLKMPQTISNKSKKLINTIDIGRKFKLPTNKINLIFSKLNWMKKDLKGWVITEQGKKRGGTQIKDKKSGIFYVCWPESITDSMLFHKIINHLKGIKANTEFRSKFKAEHRTTDGHFVRSKAEMIIDNWLYTGGIVHAYEKKLPIEENVYSDFYIPNGKVYIEYWGYENDPKYLARKKEKIELYKKYDFNLIELQDKEIQNLDDIFPKLLLKYGIKTY